MKIDQKTIEEMKKLRNADLLTKFLKKNYDVPEKQPTQQLVFEGVEMIKGKDGYTPERGVDYMTEEDLQALEEYINQNMPVADVDYFSIETSKQEIERLVKEIPTIKGDKGERGEKGDTIKGKDGQDGKDGKDGSPDSPSQIIAKVRSLKNRWNISDVKDLTARMKLLSETVDEVERLRELFEDIRIYVSPQSDGGGGTSGVISVNGETGVVVLDKTDIGLGNVDNTSDLNKPISTATQTALDLKGNNTVAATGAVIDFTTQKTFNLPSAPEDDNITDNLTGAKIGIVQKIYHNHSVEPTFPAGWVLIGGEYATSELNIIYAEWVEGTRVEYWIVQEQ